MYYAGIVNKYVHFVINTVDMLSMIKANIERVWSSRLARMPTQIRYFLR